jgi:hypothetical protein
VLPPSAGANSILPVRRDLWNPKSHSRTLSEGRVLEEPYTEVGYTEAGRAAAIFMSDEPTVPAGSLDRPGCLTRRLRRSGALEIGDIAMIRFRTLSHVCVRLAERTRVAAGTGYPLGGRFARGRRAARRLRRSWVEHVFAAQKCRPGLVIRQFE